MSTSGAFIADAANVSQMYAQRLVKDIPEDRFGRFACPGGESITANHPAFIFGHLCLYPLKVMELLGQDTSEVQPPENYEALFSKTATCVDDPEQTIYPPASEIMAFFDKSYQVALKAMGAATEEQLSAENPIDTPMKKVCPTLGSLLNFYMLGHVATHMGQLSTWRRMEGMAPA